MKNYFLMTAFALGMLVTGTKTLQATENLQQSAAQSAEINSEDPEFIQIADQKACLENRRRCR